MNLAMLNLPKCFYFHRKTNQKNERNNFSKSCLESLFKFVRRKKSLPFAIKHSLLAFNVSDSKNVRSNGRPHTFSLHRIWPSMLNKWTPLN